MTLSEILLGSGGGVFVLLTLIQVMPFKIDPWSAIARGVGKAMNKDMMDKLDCVDKEVRNLKTNYEDIRNRMGKDGADACRSRILRFSDELRRGVEHSEEFFNQILADVSDYERYCASHPDYVNSKATNAIAEINKVYQRCLEKDSFL